MVQYSVGKEKYNLSYQELKSLYITYVEMNDEEFMKNLPSALHLACVICFLKEIPTDHCLSDRGIIHEMAHLIEHGEADFIILKDVRKSFKKTLKLN